MDKETDEKLRAFLDGRSVDDFALEHLNAVVKAVTNQKGVEQLFAEKEKSLWKNILGLN